MARLTVGLLPAARAEAALPSRTCGQLGLHPGDTIRVRAGALETGVRLRGVAPPGRMLLAPDARQALSLPVGLRLGLWRNREGTLRLGPFVGIFTCSSSRHRFGPQRVLIMAVARRADGARVVAYVFTPDRIQWDTLTARGHYRQRGRWCQALLPLPDVVYDRVATRHHEALPEVVETKRQLAEVVPGGYFPPGFLGKLHAHTLLSDHPALVSHLPDTAPFSVENLERMLRRYGVVYLKPDGGSLGQGIIRARRLPGGRCAYRFARAGGGRARSPQALAARLQPILEKRAYLVQQGIRVATYGGRLFDVRVLAQKNASGRWRITRTYARVAGRGRVVSNICRGGTGLGMRRVVRRAAANRTMLRLGHEVPPALEEALGHPLGELGIDLGVTRGGKVFILEVNAKPYRMTWGWGSGPTFRHPLAYARYLARKT